MRLNIYAEELTNEVRNIVKTAVQPDGERRSFYGVGFFLASPDVLHHTATDDDRSAVTLWVPWTQDGGHDFDAVRRVLVAMMLTLDNQQMEAGSTNVR